MSGRVDELAWISRVRLFRDDQAFRKIVERYKNRVFRLFLSLSNSDRDLSEDCAQETFIRVWDSIGGLTNPMHFSTWLYRIAYNIWLDTRRRQKETQGMEGLDLCGGSEATDLTDVRDLKSVLERALSALNEQERMVISLFYLNEMSIKEISKITGVLESTVRSSLTRGRAKLRQSAELNEYWK